VPEVVASFAGREGRCESADAAAQAGNCALGSLAQTGLELAERKKVLRAAEQERADVARARTLSTNESVPRPARCTVLWYK